MLERSGVWRRSSSRAETEASEVLQHIVDRLGTQELLGLRTQEAAVPKHLATDAMRRCRNANTGQDVLQTGVIKTFCLLTLTLLTVSWSMVALRGVLMPFVLAVFAMFLLEPVLLWALNPLKPFSKLSRHAARIAKVMEEQQQIAFGSDAEQSELLCGRLGLRILWKVWCVMAVAFCILMVVVVLGACTFLVVQSFTGWSAEKYASSPKLEKVLVRFNETGIKTEKILQDLLQGPLLTVVDIMSSVLSTVLLMSLFLAFLLLSAVGKFPYTNVLGFGLTAKISVQRYLKLKVLTSVAVGVLIYLLLSLLKVELAFFFGFLTFLLNHIPHVGYTLAVLAPLPLVLLDPDKTWGDFIGCVVYPLLVHQIFITVVETRLLSIKLDLHPVVVVISLAFWTLCWGAVGAILSTPMTCMLRLALREISHPLAASVEILVSGNARKAQGPSPACSRGGSWSRSTTAAASSDEPRPARFLDKASSRAEQVQVRRRSPSPGGGKE